MPLGIIPKTKKDKTKTDSQVQMGVMMGSENAFAIEDGHAVAIVFW